MSIETLGVLTEPETEAEVEQSAPIKSGCLAMLGASAFAALLLTLGMGSIAAYVLVLPVTLLVTSSIGFLLFLAARWLGRTGWMTAACAGFVTGAVFPVLELSSRPSLDESSTDSLVTITAGQYTANGWLEQLLPIAEFGAIGLIAGLFFRFLLLRPTLSRATRIGIYTMLVASVATAVLVARSRDEKSCHDASRYEAHSLDETNSFTLAIGPRQWAGTAAIMKHFAQERHWSFEQDLRFEADFPWFEVSLCREPKTRIYVMAVPDIGPWHGNALDVYLEPESGAEGRLAFRQLHDDLRLRWPDAIRYEDSSRTPLPRPPAWAVTAPPAAPSAPSPASRAPHP